MSPDAEPDRHTADELYQPTLRLVRSFIQDLRSPATRRLGLVFMGRLFAVAALFGIGFVALAAAGGIYGIGWRAWWTNYKLLVFFSPLFGPGLLLCLFLVGCVGDVLRQLKSTALSLALSLAFFALVLIFVGYKGAREEHPSFASQPADVRALSKSLGEQNQVLGQLSDTGNALIEQLSTTQQQLDDAKKRLTATLSNLDKQREAAEQVGKELQRLDQRQQAISEKTRELERILEGQKPITRQDLQHSGNIGLLYGTVLGFIAGFMSSFVATYVWSLLRKRSPGL